MTADTLHLPDAPALPGLAFRRFRGEVDYPNMLAVLQGSKAADGIEDADTLERVSHNYAHLNNCDPFQDMVFAEANCQVVGYGRTWWFRDSAGLVIYAHFGMLLPHWRRMGIGRAMLHYLERRAHSTATAGRTRPDGRQSFYQGAAWETEIGKIRLLESEGYTPVRNFYEMVRLELDNIPYAPLPVSLEVRPAAPEHYRAIWEANVEAFRDHWSEEERTETDYERWLGGDEFAPDIWKVAWDGDQVAGMVLGYIDEAQNATYKRKRGWTENICVRRPWRKRGLARALIAENLRELRARGMTEAALGVDTENPTGALRVYESMGFRAVKREVLYRKAMSESDSVKRDA